MERIHLASILLVYMWSDIPTYASDVTSQPMTRTDDQPGETSAPSGGKDTVANLTLDRKEFEMNSSTEVVYHCPSNVNCHKLGGDCINCNFDTNCIYNKPMTVTCWPKPEVVCKGAVNFTRPMTCRYCYQSQHWESVCTASTDCRSVSAPRDRYQANCTIKEDILCLGRRRFYKMVECNWTAGYRWSTALILSVTLGGFGVDRFYLGLWREGIGKLFSFGGLGVWTLVDVVLIASGYVGPADGSLYIY